MDKVTVATINAPGCPWNDQLDCTDKQCSRCGWNPEVAAKRLEEYKARTVTEGSK